MPIGRRGAKNIMNKNSPKVWIGTVATASAFTAGVHVMVAPVELSHFHSGNFIMAKGFLSFVGLLWIFSGLTVLENHEFGDSPTPDFSRQAAVAFAIRYPVDN